MTGFTDSGRSVAVSPGPAGAPLVVLVTMPEAVDAVQAQLAGVPAHTLVTVTGFDWNDDLTPWPAAGIGQESAPFAGRGAAFARWLTETMLPRVEAMLSAPPCWRGVAGYSLAGLFAFMTLYETEWFTRAASASGSFWYPGLADYVCSHDFAGVPEALYLSIGDKERRTRHPLMREGQAVTERLAAHCRAQGIETAFRLEAGNHFQDTAGRMARGIAWLLGG